MPVEKYFKNTILSKYFFNNKKKTRRKYPIFFIKKKEYCFVYKDVRQKLAVVDDLDYVKVVVKHNKNFKRGKPAFFLLNFVAPEYTFLNKKIYLTNNWPKDNYFFLTKKKIRPSFTYDVGDNSRNTLNFLVTKHPSFTFSNFFFKFYFRFYKKNQVLPFLLQNYCKLPLLKLLLLHTKEINNFLLIAEEKQNFLCLEKQVASQLTFLYFESYLRVSVFYFITYVKKNQFIDIETKKKIYWVRLCVLRSLVIIIIRKCLN